MAKHDDEVLSSLGPTPQRVRLAARVASPNTIASPLTGARANAFMWRFWAEDADDPSPMDPSDAPERRQWATGDLELVADSGARIHVPARALSLVADDAQQLRFPLVRPIPPELGPPLDDGRMSFYAETAFREGDEVVLDAWLARSQPAAAFRDRGDAVSAPFTAHPELGPITLIERAEPSFTPWTTRVASSVYSLFALKGGRGEVAPRTSLAIALSAIGFATSACMILISIMAPIEQPVLLTGLLLGGIVPSALAYSVHPSLYTEGGEEKIPVGDVLRTAPRWAIFLCIGSGLCLLFVGLAMLGNGPVADEFEISHAGLVGRPERVRLLAGIANIWYACSLAIALSARELRNQPRD
ncbi:hypothetical protein LZC95_08180 [Pendulispora brunnea]|uniref:Uncharacterized protein n=1 Tax=Pendulispora brunnea TaxID=2905690 RepID=A0ABZ2KDU7_9BACT